MAKPALNGMDPAFVTRIENLHAGLATLKGEYMAECKLVREDIKAVYDEAKDKGIKKKALKAVVADRATEKAGKARDKLKEADKDQYDMIRHALGDLADTPLGAAALAQADNQAVA